MLEAGLIALVILLYTLQNLFCRIYTGCYPGEKHNASPVYTVISGYTVSIITLIFAGFSFSAKPLTVLFALINAAALVGYNAFIVKASQTGSYSILMVFSIAGGISLPAIVAKFAFGDPLSILKALSILVIFASVYMVSYKKEEESDEKKKQRLIFLLVCTGLAVCNGAYGALLDIQQRITGTSEKEEMVILTFLIAATVAAIQLIFSEKKKTPAAFRQSKSSLIFLVSCAVISALAINLMVYIIQLVDVTVLYCFDNSGVMVLSVLASWLLFKERLLPINIIGCATMCLALVGVTLF
jgi:drug/metabolite transporter (DMT)-like permease